MALPRPIAATPAVQVGERITPRDVEPAAGAVAAGSSRGRPKNIGRDVTGPAARPVALADAGTKR